MEDQLEGELPDVEMTEPSADAALPADLMSELPESLGEEAAMDSGDVDPMQVNYKTGEERQAQACGNCKYYTDNACSIVAGPIDTEGICNIYSPMGDDKEHMPMAEESASVEEEVPVEEPEEEMASQEGY
jgi:hypothetical protein